MFIFHTYPILIICVVVISFSNLTECKVLENVQKQYQEGDRFLDFPDGNGNFELVDLQEPIDEGIASIDVRSVVTFNLVTRNNPDQPQIVDLGDEESLINSNFKIGKTTAILSHGWQSASKDMNDVADEFLVEDDINVINIDWSPIADKNYITAKSKTSEVGVVVGDFVNWLVSCGVSYDEVHLVGISLGAQVMGSAGRETDGKVRKITGLDPAGPLWYTDKKRLQSTDAQFVEVIHTNTLFFGYKYPCGDVDIYPNGGAIMPACQSSIIKNLCSHVMSLKFFIIGLRYHDHFVANECSSFNEATKHTCNGQPFVFGTSDLMKSGSGIYRIETKRTYPY